MDLYINNFSVRVSDNTESGLFTGLGKTVLELQSDKGLFKMNPTVIIADPFLFVHNEELYLFYENQVRWYGKGCICMRKTRDLNRWTEEKVVLKESFHLSFPFVFEDKGLVYMIPETGHDGSVRLYQSEDDTLEHWKLKTKLLNDGSDWVDSSLIMDNDTYFLFTSKKADGEPYKQRLFLSDNITGPYREHPKSPVYVGDDYGRNAGSVFKYEGRWLRPTQDCSVSYGDNVSLFKIDYLTSTDYNESFFMKNILDRSGKYKGGGHQLSYAEFNGRQMVATDIKDRNYNIIELTRRIIKKIKK